MRRAVFVAVGIVCVAFGMVLACGFPSVDFAVDSDFVDGTFVPNETSSGGSSGDVFSPNDAGWDGSDCVGDPECDCDGDGDLSQACDGGDCDDRNPDVNSKNQNFRDAAPPGDTDELFHNGDWNCDEVVERQYEAGVKCSGVLNGDYPLHQAEPLCGARMGFSNDPGCGEVGSFVECKPGPVVDSVVKTCVEKQTSNVARGCR